MKDKILKLTELNTNVVELIKEEKMDDAVKKLAEIQELTKEMNKQAEEQANPEKESEEVKKAEEEKKDEELKKTARIEKAVESIEKYTTLNISADTIKDLIEQFAEMKDQVTTGTDTINKINERLEVVEKTKGTSKQTKEEINKSSNDVWDGLNIA